MCNNMLTLSYHTWGLFPHRCHTLCLYACGCMLVRWCNLLITIMTLNFSVYIWGCVFSQTTKGNACIFGSCVAFSLSGL